jgi:hypothetical protein
VLAACAVVNSDCCHAVSAEESPAPLRMAQQNVHEAVLRANDLKEVVRLDHVHLNVISTCVAVHDAMHCFGLRVSYTLRTQLNRARRVL